MRPSIHKLVSLKLYLIPVHSRVPLKFGSETLTSVTCLRVALGMVDESGQYAEGWGETPLSVQWVWPSQESYSLRYEVLKQFCLKLAYAWMKFPANGHALEAGYDFQEHRLPDLFDEFNSPATDDQGLGPMPWLAALVCNSAFDLALHDGFGRLAKRPIYDTYGPDFLKHDLARYLEPADEVSVEFKNRYPADYLTPQPPAELLAWHLVGGVDPVEKGELTGAEPNDGYPVLLTDWIGRDGLKCLKIKLRGTDAEWDYERLVKVGTIAFPLGVKWLSADFNCTVQEPAYVNRILHRLQREAPPIYERILYVEQPFAYDLERNQIDVRTVSSRKPLFLDESAHDWRMIRLGRRLGWTGVALKTCKTQTGAILSACWGRAHGMDLMVQDLTNPMLAQIPHLLLAQRVGTIMGVETNSMQFYPEASAPETEIHPGIYRRVSGKVDLTSIHGAGFGYRVEEIQRALPEPELVLSSG